MKRVLSLILALCLVLCLAACDGKNDSSETKSAAANTPKDSKTTTTAAAPATESGSSTQIRGELRDGVYVNETLKLRIPTPDGWTVYTDEQIAQANNLTAEAFKDTDISEYLKKSGNLIDMMMGTVAGDSINLVIQPANPLLSAISDEDVFAATEAEYKAQFQAAGLNITNWETVTMQVGGEDRTVLHLTVDVSGISFEEYQVWYRDSADYTGILTLTVVGSTDPQPILDSITTLK